MTEQELFISHTVLIPPSKVDWFEAIDHTTLVSEDVNGMRPKLGDELNDTLGTTYNASVRTIVDRQLEGLWLFKEPRDVALLL